LVVAVKVSFKQVFFGEFITMNKLIKGLTVAALAVSANAYAHTEHTYLQTRPQGVNLPMEYTTFNERMTTKLEDRFGGNFMVTGFYGQSTESDDLGQYFGIANKSKFTLAYGQADTGNTALGDYDLGYLIHNPAEVSSHSKSATVKFAPEAETYGARFDYYQNLDKVAKGLYLKVNLPIVCVERDMEIEVNSADAATKTALQTFFTGVYKVGQSSTTPVANAQNALINALINGDQSETGVADIEITLGYKFLYKEKYHVALNLGLTIPTGEDADGKYMYEAIYGNGGHFAFGGGLDIQARVWGDYDHNIKLNLVANYRYLFEASENRIYKGQGYATPYVNVAKDGDTIATPMPNLFTLNSDVTPGSLFDGILALAYNNGGFCFDLGYNMYFREDEDVEIKGDVIPGYYVANRDWNTGTAFNHVSNANSDLITKDSLDVDAASTPSQFTNSIYAGLGYAFKEWEYPLMMGVGGKYEWASKNSAESQWQVWLKLALSF
jgi:hypothetical protein